MRRKLKVSALVSSLALLAFGIPVTSIAVAASPNCTKILAGPQNGLNALNNLNGNLSLVAKLNGKGESEIRNLLLNDSSFWLDECGYAFYVEEVQKNSSTSGSVAKAPYSYDQTFYLHSKPGSTKTIYLDFDGHNYNNTIWTTYFRASSPYIASGYSQDGNFSNFTEAERDVIQSIWQRVSEDYAPFDVDVTTEPPASGILERADANDQFYGTRAVVTSDSSMQKKCGCGGIAYLDVFDEIGSTHEYYQPAWVFTKGVGTEAKNIAEALSHEVGHNLGLSHDGTSTTGYYSGTAGWAPIMGVGYYEGLTQWSKGQYPNANNPENDYDEMALHGVSARSDEDANNFGSARDLVSSRSGFISTPNDVDWYKFTPSASGNVTITANGSPVSQNLDIQLDLFVSTNLISPMATSNPQMVDISTDAIDGLNASISYSVVAGTQYYLRLDGVGNGSLATGGYSDYGSLGAYTINISGGANNYFISAATFSPTSKSVVKGSDSSATDTNLSLTRSGDTGSNPVATLSVDGGQWSLINPSNINVGVGLVDSLTPLSITLDGATGNLNLRLTSLSTAGIYRATLTTANQVITYMVNITEALPNAVVINNCTRGPAKNSATCSWQALSPTPTGYEYQLIVDGKSWPTAWTATTSTSATLGGLKAGVIYNFRVRAVNSAGAGPSTSTKFSI